MAKDGLIFFFPALIITIIAWGFWIINSMVSLLILGAVTGLLTLFFAFFFRDPNRFVPEGDGVLVSPADGFISIIQPLNSHPFLDSAAIQISIFLTIFDVHVNRIPVAAVVDSVSYKKGKFMPAYKNHASEANEQSEVRLVTSGGIKLVVKQIAGQIARRIVCRLEQGQNVSAGQRFGLIKFGSRTDIIVPSDTQIEVTKGQHVKGGETVIGRLAMKNAGSAEQLKSKQGNV